MVVKSCPDCRETLAVACKTCPKCGYIFQAKKISTPKHSEKKPAVLEGRLRPERNKKAAHREDEFVYHGVVNMKNSYAAVSAKEEAEKGEHFGRDELGTEKEPKIETDRGTESEMTLQPEMALTENEDSNKTAASKNEGTPPIKKRGRPKGSKDKQKRLPKGYKQLNLVRNSESASSFDGEWEVKDGSHSSYSNTANANDKESRFSRKRGRPRGSRNKPSLSPLFYAEDDDDDDDFDSDCRDERNYHIESGICIPPEKEEKFSLILEGINQRILGQTFKA